MSTGQLIEHLHHAPAYLRLKDRLASLRMLQALLDAELPAELLPGTRVASLKRGKLVIHTASGAVAVKLRQLAPRLADALRRCVPEISEIVVRVQPQRRNFPEKKTKPVPVLSNRAKQALTSLSQGLPVDSILRQAVLRLVRR